MKQINAEKLSLFFMIGVFGVTLCGGLFAKEMPPINWIEDIEKAKSRSSRFNSIFAIYFCSVRAAETAGAGSKVHDELNKKNRMDGSNKRPISTVFDNQQVRDAISQAGLSSFVKIPFMPENKKWFIRYRAIENSLIICHADGKSLARLIGSQCNQMGVIKLMSQIKALKRQLAEAAEKRAKAEERKEEIALAAKTKRPEKKKPAPIVGLNDEKKKETASKKPEVNLIDEENSPGPEAAPTSHKMLGGTSCRLL